MIKVKYRSINLSKFARSLEKLKKAYLKVAMKTVVTHIVEGIKANRQITGEGAFPRLSPITVELKGHARPLIDKGLLKKESTYSKASSSRLNSGTISIYPKTSGKDDSPRDEVGYRLQVTGVQSKDGKKFFKFFGISKDAESKIELYYSQLVQKSLEAIS